jgi:nitrate reductase alpha subunit
MVRGRLVNAWREARKTLEPIEAWAAIVSDAKTAASYKSMRGRGGFVRSTWDEVSEIIAAANVHTIKTWGPDRVVGCRRATTRLLTTKPLSRCCR